MWYGLVVLGAANGVMRGLLWCMGFGWVDRSEEEVVVVGECGELFVVGWRPDVVIVADGGCGYGIGDVVFLLDWDCGVFEELPEVWGFGLHDPSPSGEVGRVGGEVVVNGAEMLVLAADVDVFGSLVGVKVELGVVVGVEVLAVAAGVGTSELEGCIGFAWLGVYSEAQGGVDVP